jgi:hypothetical protein
MKEHEDCRGEQPSAVAGKLEGPGWMGPTGTPPKTAAK